MKKNPGVRIQNKKIFLSQSSQRKKKGKKILTGKPFAKVVFK